MLKQKQGFNTRNNKKYKVKTIQNNKVYAKKNLAQLTKLYYLIF